MEQTVENVEGQENAAVTEDAAVASVAETAESADSAEPAVSAEAAVSAGTAESAERAEPADTADSTDSAESTDSEESAHSAAPRGAHEARGTREFRERRDHRDRDRKPEEKEFVEKLVKLNRTAKVVKGGRRFSFSALTVVGDRKGRVGYGFGKANDVSEAIRKSVEKAKRNLITLPIKNGTIPHEIIGAFKASRVLLKPACSGTGIIAGGPIRAIMEAGGVTDVLSKSIGASSQYNVVKAAFAGITSMMDARALAKSRGRSMKDLWG
jgi:small subunit ribosomal protein S5